MYKPVPEPDPAYATESVTSAFAAVVPAAAGAVPATATLPETAACHAVPSVVVDCSSVEQELAVDGSPITRTAKSENETVLPFHVHEPVFHVAGVSWSTDHPAAVKIVFSGAVDPLCNSTSALPLPVGAAA
jgi:hypothetical protein